MVDWQAIQGIGAIAMAVAVVVALAFGIIQLRLQSAQRRDLAAAEMIRSMVTPEFVDALDVIFRLPDDAPARKVASDAEARRALLLVDFAFECAGVMVHDRLIPLHDVDRLLGGIVRECWRKARPFIEHERAATKTPHRGEWWQWLVERLEEDPAPGKKDGAHVAFQNWRR